MQELPTLLNISAFTLDSVEDARRSELCQAAVGYAGHGWHVVPVHWIWPDGHCSCNRPDCPSPGKHPVFDDWPHVASADRETVAWWWRPTPEGPVENWFPRANIGIVTGRVSGIFVLDVDTYAGGEQTLGAYERRHGNMPETRAHSTSRGGTHLFFRHPVEYDVRNSARRVLGKGLDVRGEAGFVVAPPSMGAHGPYELNPAHDIDPAEAPEWLLDLLRNHDREQTGAVISGAEPTEATGAARKYAEAALKAEAENMRNAEEGTRNDTLNRCAFQLGTLGGAGLLTEDAAWEVLHGAALAAGLTDNEIRGTFLSGWRSGLENPRSVQWNTMGGTYPIRSRTEFGLADRMADHFGDQLRWCEDMDRWLVYRGGVWIPATKRTGEHFAQAMIRSLEFTEALEYDDTKTVNPDGDVSVKSDREMFMEWVAKQQTRKAVSSASHLATGLQLMQMPQRSFDADPMMLNVRNGVVNLSTGELIPHDPEQRMTLQCQASYYPGEPATKFQRFLERVQPDPAMRAYIQRWAGYCATGLTVEQALALLHGSGANGKSVWQSVVAHVLGTYAQTMPVDTLMASSVDGRIPNDVARMAGKRFLLASETKAGKALDEQKIKQLTGGDSISARFMRGEWFDFRVVGKLQLATNHLPRLSDDDATWRRIHVVPWSVVIPEDERDGYLQDTLIREESDGILAWIVEGALAWHAEGLARPPEAREATEAYREDENEIAQFVRDCLVVIDPPRTKMIGSDVATIYQTYAAWARSEGHPVYLQHTLTNRLKKINPTYKRSGGWTGFAGLRVRMPGEDG